MKVSVIIPTYNREKNIFKILKLLNEQICISDRIEVLICDSNSKKKTSLLNFIKLFKKLKIQYFNLKINHQAFKRNFGIQMSQFENIILIDDDCFPTRVFIANHLKILKLAKKREIYCGAVKYSKTKKNTNLVNFRESRLINFLNKNHQNIDPKNFISMNMSFKKTIENKKIILFDSKFRHYGFEDFEFAYRLSSQFRFRLINALIYHKDNRNFDQFLMKYYNLGKFGINDIIKINLNAAKQSIYYSLDNHSLNRLFKQNRLINQFLVFLEFFFIQLEKKMIFPFFFYKISTTLSFLRGSNERIIEKNSTNIDLKKWYR